MNGYPGPHYAYAYEQHRRHFEPPMHPMHPHNRPSPYATYPTGPPPPQYQHMSLPYATYLAGPPPPQYSHKGCPPNAYSHVPPSPSLSASSSVSSELAGLSSPNQAIESTASVESAPEGESVGAIPPRSKKERLLARMATPSPSPSDANVMSPVTPPTTPSPSNSSSSTSSSAPSSPTSSPSPSKSNGKWTESEDAGLRAAVAANSARNWKKIASSLPNRTDVQCLHRWQKVLRPGLVKGPWTADEDCRLVDLIQQHGVRRWSFLAKQLHTGRLGKQCRERWYNHLDPAINKGPWTRAEDDAVVAAYEEMGSKWARIAKAVGNGRTDNAIKNRWNSMLRRVVKGDIARPSYADEETKEETPSTAGRPKKRSRESVDDDIDFDLLSKDRGQCTSAELDQIRRERNRLNSRRSRERKRARFVAAAAEQNSIRKVSTATPPPPSPLTLDEHASSAPSTPSTLADAIKSIRSDLSDDDAIAAEALSTLIGTTNTTKPMNHVPRPVSVTNTPSSVTSVISYSSDAESSTSTASGANRPPTVPRQRREDVSTEGMADLTLPTLPSSSVVGRHPQLPPGLGATRKASSKDEFLKVLRRTSSNQGGVEDAVGLLLHFNNHTRALQYRTGQ